VVTCMVVNPEFKQNTKRAIQRAPCGSIEEFVGIYGDFPELRVYGISIDYIMPAVDAAIDMEPVMLNITDWSTAKTNLMNALPETGLLNRMSRVSSSSGASPTSTPRETMSGSPSVAGANPHMVIMSDPTDTEATCSGLVLKWMMQETLQKPVCLDVGMATSEFHKLIENPKVVNIVWLLTTHTLKSQRQLARLACVDAIRGASSTFPILIGEFFEFPTDEYYNDLAGEETQFGARWKAIETLSNYADMPTTPDNVIAALQAVFKSVIAVKINIGAVNYDMLKVSVDDAAKRLQGMKEHVWNPSPREGLAVQDKKEEAGPAP